MNEFEIVKVNDQLILELTGCSISIKGKDLIDIARNSAAPEDELDYKIKETKFREMLEAGSTSRRLVVQFPVTPTSDLNCISLIQVLKDRKNSKIITYLRSSNLKKIDSDLGFFCRLALIACVAEVNVTIGSAHIYLENTK